MKNPALTIVFVALCLVSFVSVCGVVGLGLLAAIFTSHCDYYETIHVAVAAVDLPAGTVLDAPEKQLMLKPYLPDAVPPGAVANVEVLRGKTLVRALKQGVPCLDRDVLLAVPGQE